jgi:hypothetical protein
MGLLPLPDRGWKGPISQGIALPSHASRGISHHLLIFLNATAKKTCGRASALVEEGRRVQHCMLDTVREGHKIGERRSRRRCREG